MIPTDWIYGLIGGVMIGAAAAMFLLINGRIMGASGLLGGIIDGTGKANMKERLAFIAGLIGVPAIVYFTIGAPATNVSNNMLVLLVAGLAVGVGTRMANGCTSGHGVCGISRFSVRGIAATLIYLLAGGVTMLVLRHGLGVI
ncbi:YeeE/YedE family protein [Rhodobacteraceae bacterium HTCC2150]|nr:YeeE/YedE family protein [Rhodobacteraceae bacterium HTCC2150]